VFNGDIRRALLALQLRLETGSTCHQKMTAPVHGPDVSALPGIAIETGTDVKLFAESACPRLGADATKPSVLQSLDSGDEFVHIRPRKRRALRVASSDEDSQSLGDAPTTSSAPVISDSNTHKHCEVSSASATVNTSKQSADAAAEMVTDHPPVAMAAELAPPIYRLGLSTIGHLQSLPHGCCNKLQVRLIPDLAQEICCCFFWYCRPTADLQSTASLLFAVTHTHTHTRLTALFPGLPR